jgi:hypothetical protein
MTANSTPESFDAVLAEMRCPLVSTREIPHDVVERMFRNIADRLQSAHARELDALRIEASNWKLQSDDWQSRGWAVGKDLEKVQGQVAEQQATIEALRGEVARRTRECELKTVAIDRWVPCPDHRDKTERGVCQVCDREKAEARADAAMGLLRRWAMCGSPQNATLTQETDAFLAEQALANTPLTAERIGNEG